MKMKKVLAMACAMALTAAIAVGGTLAYLTSTDNVTNTFTVGNVAITLDEAKVNPDGTPIAGEPRVDNNQYKLMPGHLYMKDPAVHVDANSEDSYLFVKVVNQIANLEATGSTTIASQMTAKGWDAVDNQANVYIYAPGDDVKTIVKAGQTYGVFDSFTLADNADLSKLTDTDQDGIMDQNIVVTAYAVQADGFADKTPADIWTAANFS